MADDERFEGEEQEPEKVEEEFIEETDETDDTGEQSPPEEPPEEEFIEEGPVAEDAEPGPYEEPVEEEFVEEEIVTGEPAGEAPEPEESGEYAEEEITEEGEPALAAEASDEEAAAEDTFYEEGDPTDAYVEETGGTEEFSEEIVAADDTVTEVETAEDAYVEESEESWFSRMGGAVKGVVIGLIIFLIGFPLLFWNEGRAVKRYKTLKEGAGSVVSVPPDQVSPQHEGKLVHVTGVATTDEMLTDAEGNLPRPVSVPADRIDPQNEGKLIHVTGTATSASNIPDRELGVSANAIKLARIVEMYQWKENRGGSRTGKKLGGKEVTQATYSYGRGWSDKLISSAAFKQTQGHQNPAAMPYQGRRLATKRVTLGAFQLPERYIRDMNRFEPLVLRELPPDLPSGLGGKVHLFQGGLYIGADPRSPQVGDVRIRYEMVKPAQPVSIIARQQGNTFAPYSTGSGGQTVDMLTFGNRSAAEMMPAGIAVNALQLKRTVQMYQWRENRSTKTVTKADGKKVKQTQYSYNKVWSDRRIDSGQFKKTAGHANPPAMPLESRTVMARNVTLGAYQLPERFVSRISTFEPLPEEQIRSALPAAFQDRATFIPGGYYVGKNAQSPAIGDLKVTYAVVNPQPVTVVAQQSGSTFVPYVSRVSGTLEEFSTGSRSSEEIFGKARDRNATMTWILRFAGLAVMFIGLLMVFRPISVVMDVIPFLGNLAEKGVALIAFLLAAGFALITIAIAWIFYRPLFGAILIAVAAALIFGTKMLRERRGEPVPA